MDSNLKHILELAIAFEKESYHFYTTLKNRVKEPQVIEILEQLATAELGHRKKLETILHQGITEGQEIFKKLKPREVEDMKLSDYLQPVKLDNSSTFQDIMIAAMHREKGAYDFYRTMAKLAATNDAKALFEFLAAEELEHKSTLERLYDEEVYTEF